MRIPRKALRALRFVLIAAAVAALCWSRACKPAQYHLEGQDHSTARTTPKVDYAWGSIIHRYQNHPRPARARRAFPWTESGSHGRRADGSSTKKRTRVLIVTSELSGLHKNGGIGTAFRELAHTLADADLETSILVAHLADSFPYKKRDALVQDLGDRQIRLLFVDKEPQLFWPQAWTPVASMRVWRYLRAHDGEWDVIHFPDNTGIGYFAALGKHEGLALGRSRIVVGLHGADVEWAAMLNKRYPVDKYAVELGVFERRTAEWADAVVAPSEYMLEYVRQRGWAVPNDSFVIPNVVQTPTVSSSGASAASDAVQPVTELVFFGRLEERKGTRLLISALEALYSLKPIPPALAAIRQITFLGRDQQDVKTRTEASSLLAGALDAIQDYTGAKFSYEFLRTYDRDDALAYLQNSSRLALLPSLADNSPSTVLECIAHGVRFISSNIGGIPELIHPDDREQVVFSPLVKPFSFKLRQTLERLELELWTQVRPAPETQRAVGDWVALHHWLVSRPAAVVDEHTTALVATSRPHEPLVSICVTHYERPHLLPQLLNSLLRQTYRSFEVILVDDGSSSPDTLSALDNLTSTYFSNATLLAGRPPWQFRQIPNSYLGEARNIAASAASGQWLLFLDDDDVLKPHALAKLLSVAARTGARALSSWLDEFATDVDPLAPRPEGVELPHRRTYWFLGQELSAGLLSNAYGSGNIFVARETFDKLGGFSTYREVGGEDWEFYTRLALEEGEKHLVVPEELIFARSDPARASMKWTMDPWDAHFHATVPVLNDPRVQALNLAPALQYLKAAITREHTPPAFADSRRDFQLSQGWSGWFYSFEPAGPIADLALAPERRGVVEGATFIMDREHPGRPFIDDVNQQGFVTPDGSAIAAVRTFRSPKAMDVAIDASYRSVHTCGDGTRLSVVLVGGSGELPEVLHEWATMDEGFAEWAGEASLRAGSTLSLISDPLETDECDRVEVSLRLTPVSPEKKGWSGLARAAAWRNAEAKKALEHAAAANRGNQSAGAPAAANGQPHWTPAEPPKPSSTTDDQLFNVALIFDQNRLEHAKSVIRSVRHFTTSRAIVFHLIAPPELHHDLEQEFNVAGSTVRTYDHALCGFVVKKVLPFSNPDIHTSAHCKMFLTEIVTIAERVLYLDTDVTVVSDLAACYGRPVARPGALISMGVDMGDVCQRQPNLCWPIGLHWRVPSSLECGNVPSRSLAKPPASCAREGELEMLQVNGGVALFELAKMREVGFVDQYVQSIVHHFRIMGSVPAKWGEQDFVNSYFRLHPEHLELLPCGCNYQWFGARREVMCGNQPVAIAHHWSHGIATRNKEPYNVLFHHFVDAAPGAPLPLVPDQSYSAPGAPNFSTIEFEHTLNCPRQDHDCTARLVRSEYGQNVIVLSRVTTETFAADQVDSLEAQTYPYLSQAIAYRAGEIEIPSLSFQRDEVVLHADPADEYAVLCDKCSALAVEGASCTTAPAGPKERQAYFDCVCALPDRNAQVMYDLEAFARDDGGWVLYMDDSTLFVAPESLSLLMAEVDARDELVLFRSNTSSYEQEYTFRRKILPRSPLDGVGVLFHSSHLEVTTWSSESRCGKWATVNRLAARLRIKWLDLVPTMEHPLQRHLPATPVDAFKFSVIVLETQGRIAWTPLVIELFQSPEVEPLVSEIVVASVDSPEGVYGIGVPVINPTLGSGMAELASLVSGERVLLISDSVLLDKPAITALLTFHLDQPSRLLGLFTETDDGEGGDFSTPLDTSPDTFDFFSEHDALVGLPSWTHLRPRALFTPRAHLDELAKLLAARPAETPLHPACHPVLLSALSTRASGLTPLRVLPPKRSVVDRVYDCRVRNWADVDYGLTAGDWAVPVPHVDEDEDESVEGSDGLHHDARGAEEVEEDDDADGVEADAEGQARAVQKRSHEHDDLNIDEADFPLPPTLDECVALVSDMLGPAAEQWLVPGSEVGVAGPLGVRVGMEEAANIDEKQWQRARRVDRCYRM